MSKNGRENTRCVQLLLLFGSLTLTSSFTCPYDGSVSRPFQSVSYSEIRQLSSPIVPLHASKADTDIQAEMQLATDRLNKLQQRPTADDMDEDDPYSAERQTLFQELRQRPANDLKAELKSLHLKVSGRKPDLARRLADYHIEQMHENGASGEYDDDDGIDTVPAQQVDVELEGGEGSNSPVKELKPLKKFAGLANLSLAAGTALARAQFDKPSPIQAAAIPTLARRQSCILHAETGSGKTLSYLLPITEQLWKETDLGMLNPVEDDVGFAIVLTPTRELAAQVAGVATVLAPPGTVRLISHPTNLMRPSPKEKGESGHGGRSTDANPASSSRHDAPPRLIVGSAKAVMTSLFGNSKMPAPPTTKPEAKLFLDNVRWLVMDEVDRLLNVKKTRSEKAYKKHEKPAAVLTSAIARYTLGKAQIIAASATVGRPLKRELARTLGLPAQECPPVIRGVDPDDEDKSVRPVSRFGDITRKGGNEDNPLGRLVTIPPTVQNYVLPSMGYSSGQLLTTAASIIKNLPTLDDGTRARRVLLVLSKGCELNVRNALGALQHFQCDPPPRALIDVLEADGTDRMIEVHRKVSGATGVGESSGNEGSEDGTDNEKRDEGYLYVTGEDSVRGLHLDNLDTVICVGRPRGPDEYTHIAGRTGRAGKKGTVINVVSYEQATALTSWGKMLDVEFIPLEEDEISSLQ